MLQKWSTNNVQKTFNRNKLDCQGNKMKTNVEDIDETTLRQLALL